jgi:subtilase family protein
MNGRAVSLAAALAVAAALAAPAGGAGHRLRDAPAPKRPPPTLRALVGLEGAHHALIQLDRGHGPSAVSLLRRSGAELLAPELRLWRVPREAASTLVPLLRLAGVLQAVEPDRPLRRPSTHITSGDPLVPNEYWLAKVGADKVEPPGPGRPVTLVDTGLDLAHPEFAQRPSTTLLNTQYVSGKDDDHGTEVASVIAAPTNGLGLVGIYPQAALQLWDATPSGSAEFTVGDEVRGILAAARGGAGVINLSLGSESYDQIEEEAILTAFRLGSIVVASSGNEFQEGNPVEYPASLNHVLTVAGTDAADEPAFFSSSSLSVDLAAPAEDIPVAKPLAYEATGYAVDDGTSFSAPLVAGATAWVWTARPELDNTQIFELMRRSARDVWDSGYDEDTGFGVLDIPRALATLPLPPDPQEPNDDIDQVKPGGLFGQAARPLNSSSRPTASLRARVDASEDPDDIYRIYLPPGRSVTVFVTGDRDIDLDLWGLQTRTVFEKGSALKRDLLAASERPGKRQELIRYANRGRRGITLYVDVFLGKKVRSAHYALSVTPGPAPR